MAFNVFLTVSKKRNATELKKVDFVAVLPAYALPLTQALVHPFSRHNGETVYGPATLYCWIAKKLTTIRLVALFVPVWCVCDVLKDVFVTMHSSC